MMTRFHSVTPIGLFSICSIATRLFGFLAVGTHRGNRQRRQLTLSPGFLLVLLALGLPGCATLFGPSSPTPPLWYTTRAVEPPGTWWGYGEGPNRQQAVQKALVDVASRIKTTVSDELRVQTGQYDERTRSNISQLTRQTIDETQFIGYDIVQHEQRGETAHFAQVAVDRNQYLAQRYDELKNIDQRLTTSMDNFILASAAGKLKKRFELQNQLAQARGLVEVLNAFGYGQDTKATTERYRQYDTDLTRASNSIDFFIEYDAASRYIFEHLKDLLTEQNLPIVERRGSPYTTISIKLSTDIKQYARDRETRATLTTRFTVNGGPGEQIGSRQEVVSAASLKGREKAVESASQLMRQRIAEAGVLAFLGF